MKKLHTLIMLLSCQKTNDRRDACRETWMRADLPDDIKVVFLIGRPGQHPAIAGDVLYVDAPDTYLGLPLKVWAGLREAFNLWDFDWVFKADDDTWVSPTRVRDYVKSNDYMGRSVGITPDPNWHANKCMYFPTSGDGELSPILPTVSHTQWRNSWAGGGVGYFLSRRAAQLVADEPLSHIVRESYEDKMTGDIMSSHNIHLHGAHQTLRPIGPKGEGNIYGATSIHPLLPGDMRNVYWKLLRAGEIGT